MEEAHALAGIGFFELRVLIAMEVEAGAAAGAGEDKESS